jgi:hypothetical protein
MRTGQIALLAFFCAGSTCQTPQAKNALSGVETCLVAGAASAAQPLLGIIGSALLDPSTTPEDVKQQMLALASTYGIPAVLCALDTWIAAYTSGSGKGQHSGGDAVIASALAKTRYARSSVAQVKP